MRKVVVNIKKNNKMFEKHTKPGIFVSRCSARQRYLGVPSASRPPRTGLLIDTDPLEPSPQKSVDVVAAAVENNIK